MRVLGIDPGLRVTGYACVQSGQGRAVLVEAGVVRLLARPGPTDNHTTLGTSVAARLVRLDRELSVILDRVKPQAVAIEGLFAHRTHPATAMVLGHARGVLVRCVQARGLKLLELKPALVKKHMTGSGRAEKGQMQRAVQAYFSLPALPTPADMADALAIAVCACDNLASLASDTPGQAGNDELLARIASRRGGGAKDKRKPSKALLAALKSQR
jgi:crossover junction endodeoxyribonuclease RuvC